MFDLFRRSAPLVSLAGIVVLLAGLSLDAVVHRVNPEAAHQGGISSLFNSAHFVPAVGIALCLVGALLLLLGRAGESGISFLRRTAFVGMASMLSLLAFVTLVLSASVLVRGEDGHAGDHVDVDQVSATTAEQGQTGDHDHGGDYQVSATEQEAAAKLVSDTEAGVARFEDFEAARTEGYEQMRGKRGNRSRTSRPMTFISKEYVEDGRVLDPEHPEALMYKETRDGEMALIGVMYIAPRGEGPTDGGELIQWHTHKRLCIGYDEEETGAIVSLRRPGGCAEGSSPASELEMMHV